MKEKGTKKDGKGGNKIRNRDMGRKKDRKKREAIQSQK
jgi:hypothetical protein